MIVPVFNLHHSMDFPLSFGKGEELCIINKIGWLFCNSKLERNFNIKVIRFWGQFLRSVLQVLSIFSVL